MKKIWLYVGIMFACTGIGTGFGLFLIMLYFWDDIKRAINSKNFQHSGISADPRFYDDDTVERMR